jgi:hypothetical protein
MSPVSSVDINIININGTVSLKLGMNIIQLEVTTTSDLISFVQQYQHSGSA